MAASMITSGETAITTSGAEEKVAIEMPAVGYFRNMYNIAVTNGSVAGFFSVDNGESWVRMPASETVVLRDVRFGGSVKVKGTNLADVYVSIW